MIFCLFNAGTVKKVKYLHVDNNTLLFGCIVMINPQEGQFSFTYACWDRCKITREPTTVKATAAADKVYPYEVGSNKRFVTSFTET